MPPRGTERVTDTTPVSSADLGLFTEISGVTLAPDASRVAAVLSTPDVGQNIYRRVVVTVPADGGGAPAQSLAPGSAAAESLPAWAPAGRRLAVVRQREDGCGIWVHDLSDGTATCALADWPDPVEELTWSPAGDRLLFVVREPADAEREKLPESRRPPLRITTLRYREDGIGWTVNRPRQAYVLPLVPGARPRKVSAGGYDDAEFSWHPDGRRVVFVSQRQPGADTTIVNDVFVQDVDSADPPVRLTPTSFACSHPAVSPDGLTVAFIAMEVARFPAVSELATVPLSGGDVTRVSAALDRDCNSPSSGMRAPVWDAAGGLLVLVEDAGAICACRFAAGQDGEPAHLLTGPRRVTSLDERLGVLAFVASGPGDPPRLAVARAGEPERTILAPNETQVATRQLRTPSWVRLRTGGDVAVDTWLTLPDPALWAAPHPLLLCLQGGGTQYGYQWSHEFQVLAASGFALLQMNPRGSAGYGNAWQRTLCGPAAHTPGTGWGSVDVDDVASAVSQTLAATPDLDGARVGVQGGSYGGLLTTFLLAKTDIFAAGWAERGPYNLVSLAGTNDESPWFFETYLGRTVVEDPAAYWAASPLRLARGITAPLAIMHSEEDRRCPVQQAEELFMALKVLGRRAELIRFPGEGHGLSRTGSPVHRVQRLDLMVEWFTRWLCPEPRTEGAS